MPEVREVALRRLQGHLLPAWNLLGQHFGVVRWAGGEAVGSEFTSDEFSEPLDDASSRYLGGLHKHIQHKGKLCNKRIL